MFSAETQETVTAPSVAGSPMTQTEYPFRLLHDETVLGAFPVARRRRPLGKIASYLFVTDSRVIYSAEAKSMTSSSTHLKEYQVQTVTGVEVDRHRGLDPLGAAAALGAGLNFIGLVIIASLFGASSQSSYGYYSSSPFAGLGVFFGILAPASLIVGIVVVAVLARPTAGIGIVGPGQKHAIARDHDLLKIFIVILLFVIFGPLISLAVVIWVVLRELGIFRAEDAQLFADSNSVDRIAYEIGALILDVQARGKFAGQN